MMHDVLVYAPENKVLGIWLTFEKLKMKWTDAEANPKNFFIIRKDFALGEADDIIRGHYKFKQLTGKLVACKTAEGNDHKNMYDNADFEELPVEQWTDRLFADTDLVALKNIEIAELKQQIVDLKVVAK